MAEKNSYQQNNNTGSGWHNSGQQTTPSNSPAPKFKWNNQPQQPAQKPIPQQQYQRPVTQQQFQNPVPKPQTAPPQQQYAQRPATQQGYWKQSSTSPQAPKQYSGLAYVERKTLELANKEATVANLANAALVKAQEVMEEVKRAGLLTHFIKDGKTYPNKMMVKVEPAIKYDTREPILHSDGSPVYNASIKLSTNNSTLQMTLQETRSHDTHIVFMSAFAQNKYVKQADIPTSLVDENLKAIANLVQEKFLTEPERNQTKTTQQSYSRQPVSQGNSQKPISQQQYQRPVTQQSYSKPAQSQQQYQRPNPPQKWNTPQPTHNSAPKNQTSWVKPQTPTPTGNSTFENLKRKINAYFNIHSEAVCNKENRLVNNAYAQTHQKKDGSEVLYISNHTDTIVVELGLNKDGSLYAKALDWTLTEQGLPRQKNDKSLPASFMLNNEIDIHNYINLDEIKRVVGNYLGIEIHFPKTIEEDLAVSAGNYDWIEGNYDWINEHFPKTNTENSPKDDTSSSKGGTSSSKPKVER